MQAPRPHASVIPLLAPRSLVGEVSNGLSVARELCSMLGDCVAMRDPIRALDALLVAWRTAPCLDAKAALELLDRLGDAADEAMADMARGARALGTPAAMSRARQLTYQAMPFRVALLGATVRVEELVAQRGVAPC